MKLLWLTHPECDYNAFFLFNGLRQLGVDVVDYPYNRIYHGESATYPSPWYGEGKMGFTNPPGFFKNWDGINYSEEEIFGMLRQFDLVVCESPRATVRENLGKLNKSGRLPPIVLVDGEDYDYVHEEMLKDFGAIAYLKRELSLQRKDVYPFPFSSYVVDDERYAFKDDEKEIDVFFIAGNTSPQRPRVNEKLLDVVRKHGYKAIVGLDREFEVDNTRVSYLASAFKKSGIRLEHVDYLRNIAESKIAVSVRGWGRDTLRYWEIPSYNTLLFSDNLSEYGLIHPEPFTHGENAVFFKADCSNLEELLVYYLENDAEREKVAKAGHEHLCKYHTNRRRGEQFLKIVEEWI